MFESWIFICIIGFNLLNYCNTNDYNNLTNLIDSQIMTKIVTHLVHKYLEVMVKIQIWIFVDKVGDMRY